MTVWCSRRNACDLAVRSSRPGTRSAAWHRSLLGRAGQATVVVSSPIPSIQRGHGVARLRGAGRGRAASRGGPACRWRSGRPARSSRWRLRNEMISATEKRIDDVRPSWIGSPLIVQPRRRSRGSSSSAGDDDGPDRAEAGHRLAQQPLVAVEPRVARRDVVHDRVAEDVGGGLGRRDVPGERADHDAELHLRVDVGRQRAVPGDRRAVADRRRSAPCRRSAAARAGRAAPGPS